MASIAAFRLFKRLFQPMAVAVAFVAMTGGTARAEAVPNDEVVQPAPEGNSLFGSYLAARFASAERDRANAAGFFADALELDPENRMLLERAIVYLISSGDIAAALDLAPRVLAAAPENRDANMLLGIDALKRGDYEGAISRFSVKETGPIAQLTTTLLGMWTHQAASRPDQATAVLDEMDRGSAIELFRFYHAGLLATLQGRADLAEESFAKAYETMQSVITVDAYGRFLESHGKRDRAIEIYRSFLESSPGFPIVVDSLARAESGHPVAPYISDALQGAAETLYMTGATLTGDGGGDLALVYLNLALHLRPDFDLANYVVAEIHDRQRRYEEAIAAYTAVSDRSPLKREAEINAALNLDALDRTEEARARLDRLIAIDPTDSVALMSAGTMLRGRERFEQAEAYYSKAIDLIDEPTRNDWQVFYYRGICFERLGQWDRAEADLQKALELEPNQALVLNYLGYSWIDLGLHLDQALGMIEMAVEQRPDDGYIVDSLGWAYYRLGDFERAVEELERAVELRPDDPVINDHLGDAYWRVGRKLEARFQWSHALAMEPEDKEVPKIERKIADGMPELDPPAPATAKAGDVGDADGSQATPARE